MLVLSPTLQNFTHCKFVRTNIVNKQKYITGTDPQTENWLSKVFARFPTSRIVLGQHFSQLCPRRGGGCLARGVPTRPLHTRYQCVHSQPSHYQISGQLKHTRNTSLGVEGFKNIGRWGGPIKWPTNYVQKNLELQIFVKFLVVKQHFQQIVKSCAQRL